MGKRQIKQALARAGRASDLVAPSFSAKGYNPDQERDDHGRWTSGGGEGDPSKPDPSHPSYQAGHSRYEKYPLRQDQVNSTIKEHEARLNSWVSHPDWGTPQSRQEQMQFEHGMLARLREMKDDPNTKWAPRLGMRDLTPGERDHANSLLRQAGQPELGTGARIRTSLDSEGNGRIRVHDEDGSKRITFTSDASGHGEGSYLQIHGVSRGVSDRVSDADLASTGGDAALYNTAFGLG